MHFKFLLPIFCLFLSNFSQGQEDTLIIKFSKDLLNDKVYINSIDIYGKKIKKDKTANITFLYTSPQLKNKLTQKNEEDSIAKLERDKNPGLINYKGYSSGPPQFGIQLNYYQLDSIGLKNYIKTKRYYDSSIDNLKNSGVSEEKFSQYKNDLYKTLSPPLKQLYVNENFIKNKSVFQFTGTLESYEKLKNHLEKFEFFFIMLPYSSQSLYNYNYHLIQVKERYIAPEL